MRPRVREPVGRSAGVSDRSGRASESTSRARWAVLSIPAVVLCLLVPASAGAQEGPPPPRPDTTELVFDREVFNYPAFQRRNPFDPLVDDDEAGPRFEDLTLLGIIYSPDPDFSVALIAEGVSYDEQGTLQVQQGRGGVEVEEQEGEAQATEEEQEGEAEAPTARDIRGTGYRTYRVKAGEVIGNTRILEIQRMRVIVEVEEFGLTERRELRLRTPGATGGQP